MEQLAIFFAGMAAGVFWYRTFIIRLLREPKTICDICEFSIEKEKLFPKGK